MELPKDLVAVAVVEDHQIQHLAETAVVVLDKLVHLLL
jgi:hypothetical protein